MNKYATHPQPQRDTSGKVQASPDTPKHRQEFEWPDNRPEAARQQQLTQLIRQHTPDEQFSPFPTPAEGGVLQRQPIQGRVTGITHLVQIKGRSIFEGEVVKEVSESMEIILDPTDRIRSRRGPNQTYHRADDWEGEHIYRWIRVTSLNGEPLPPGTYIRDDTFIPQQPLPYTPLSSLPGRRKRRGELPRQKILLVGSKHGDHSRWNDEMTPFLKGADVLVEYPLGSRPSTDDKRIPRIIDRTQNDFIAKAPENGARVIGTDSRKRVTTEGVEAMSLRHQNDAKVSELNPDTLSADLNDLASRWFSCCLALSLDDNPEEIASTIAGLVDYGEAKMEQGHIHPNVQAICMDIFHRVRTFTKYFKPEVKETTKEVLESGLTADLTEAASNYQTYLETIAEQIQEKEENIKKTEQSLEAMEKDSEDYTRTKAVYTELQNEREAFIRYRDNDLAVIYREEAVSAFHDALCNLTLFVETLARGRSNLIVAFGNLHVQLLKSLLEKVDKQHKDYELYEPPK